MIRFGTGETNITNLALPTPETTQPPIDIFDPNGFPKLMEFVPNRLQGDNLHAALWAQATILYPEKFTVKKEEEEAAWEAWNVRLGELKDNLSLPQPYHTWSEYLNLVAHLTIINPERAKNIDTTPEEWELILSFAQSYSTDSLIWHEFLPIARDIKIIAPSKVSQLLNEGTWRNGLRIIAESKEVSQSNMFEFSWRWLRVVETMESLRILFPHSAGYLQPSKQDWGYIQIALDYYARDPAGLHYFEMLARLAIITAKSVTVSDNGLHIERNTTLDTPQTSSSLPPQTRQF